MHYIILFLSFPSLFVYKTTFTIDVIFRVQQNPKCLSKWHTLQSGGVLKRILVFHAIIIDYKLCNILVIKNSLLDPNQRIQQLFSWSQVPLGEKVLDYRYDEHCFSFSWLHIPVKIYFHFIETLVDASFQVRVSLNT